MSSVRFAIGVAVMLLGYTALYSGQSNLLSGGHGTGFLAALGFSNPISHGDGAVGQWATTVANDIPNLTGNTPQKGGSAPVGNYGPQIWIGP